jgi:predicted phosphoribosyltransferase
MRRLTLALALALGAILVAPQVAQAHVERPSYWPDPNADCSVSPCAGGAIPTARSLASALNASLPGDTRVVCKPNSMTLLNASIDDALAHGYYVRPTDHRTFTATQAQNLRQVNQQL